MKQHHNPHRPAAALLLWCLLLICTYSPANAQQQQQIVKSQDGKPLLNVKKGMYGADFKAPVLRITPPPKFLDSLINVKVGDTFGTAPTQYGEKIGYMREKIDLKKHGKLKKVNDSLYVFKVHIIVEKAKDTYINFKPKKLNDKNEPLPEATARPPKTQIYVYNSKGSLLIGPMRGPGNIVGVSSNEYIVEIKLSSKENYDKMNFIIDFISFHYFNPPPAPLNEKKNAVQQNVSCFSDITCPEGYCWHNESNGVGILKAHTYTINYFINNS